MTATRRALVPAIGGLRASPNSYYGVGAAGTNPAEKGPAGSASMTFFALFSARHSAAAVTRAIFNRTTFVGAGWAIYITTSPGTLTAYAYNSTPAAVTVSAPIASYDGFDSPHLAVASYQNGTLSLWVNGVLAGTTVLGAGFTSVANRPTVIGVSANSLASFASGVASADCGMLDTYDAASYVDPIFGNGGVGLSMRWLADLREGRYLTWPRAGTANADWYWAARDCVEGPGSLATTWVDRYSGVAMLKFGQPQGASFPARF